MKREETSMSSFLTYPISRRDVLRGMLYGAAGLALGPLAGFRTAWAQPPSPARSVIQIWMWGGPSHLDTFDPKPGSSNNIG